MNNDRNAGARACRAAAAISEETMAAIASDYLETAMPVREILERHGIKSGEFYKLARANGWGRRRPKQSRRRRSSPNDSAVMLQRLRKLARRRIATLERAARNDSAGSAGEESLTKTLTALLGLLMRIEQLKAASAADKATAAMPMTPEEADERRQKLAQMLVAMLEQAGGQQLPGGS